MARRDALVATFQKRVKTFPQLFSRLEAAPLNRVSELSSIPAISGVYVIFNRGKPLYVGRSRNVRRRMRHHVRPKPGQSAFAFRLARERTGNVRATYVTVGSRKMLMADRAFVAAFVAAAERIGRMSVRYVEIGDPVTQCLFEVYVSLAYATPYNDFDTH